MRDGWETKALGDVCLTIQDGAHESPKMQFDAPGDGRFLYITSKNIRTNCLSLENVSYVDRSFHDRIYPRCQPRAGDVLLTKDGANTGTSRSIRLPSRSAFSRAFASSRPIPPHSFRRSSATTFRARMV